MQKFEDQSGGQQPPKTTTLHVFMAFDRDEEGALKAAFEAQQMPSEFAAISRAKLMSKSYAGVIAWSRLAKPDVGEFGQPTVLYQAGDVPDME